MINRDPKPEVLRLEELALQVKAGDIKLPKFQRPFVWKRNEMLLLLDSIYKGYPIGSLLLWNSSQKLKSVRDIADLKVDDQVTAYPTSYLLDGQQRLTTLCGALFWGGGPAESVWNIHFNLESEEFVHGKGVDTTMCLPLNKLIDTGDFIAQCMRFQHLPTRDAYTARAQKLLRSIKDYKIAVVKIGDMSIEEVAPIFERINSTGRKLTMVDLMMAATWSNGFDLSHQIQAVRESSDACGLSGVSDQYVLRSIAAAADFGVNKEDIQKLRKLSPESLMEGSHACRTAFEKAAKWVSQTLFVQDASFLPYGLFLTHVVEAYRIAGELTKAQLEELERWFWFTSATSYFAGASTGQNSRDIKTTRSFAKGEISELFERKTIEISKLLFDKFNLKNASSTTLALALLSQRPQTSISGSALNLDFLVEKGARLYYKLIDGQSSGRNICIAINPYREGLSKAAPNQEVLKQHLLTPQAVDAFTLFGTEEFLLARGGIIADFIRSKTGCEVAYSLAANGIDLDDSADDFDSDSD